MNRQTRSGAVFAAWNYDPGPPTVIETGVSLATYMEAALTAADLRADQQEARSDNEGWQGLYGDERDAEWEDSAEVSTRPASPVSDASDLSVSTASPRASSPLTPLPAASLAASPTASPTASLTDGGDHFDYDTMPPLVSDRPIERRRRNQAADARRRRKRDAKAAKGPLDKKPNLRYDQGYRTLPPERVGVSTNQLPHSRTGWVGLRGAGSKGRRGRKLWTVDELTALGYRRVKWNGRQPLVIIDSESRIVAAFVGKPDDRTWDSEVIPGACRAMNRAARRGLRRGAFTPKDRVHRRGTFLSLTAGVSYGGGQKFPGNLVNSRPKRRLISRLLKNKYIQRIAGFQSSAFAYWAPKVFGEYLECFQKLFEKYPGLEHNFSNSIFPAATFNCSPDSVSFVHTDYHNLPSGWCAITSGGRFNHEESALFYMKQYKMMVEFPSGSTGFILSGAVDHGNTRLASDETRYSMTQYAAGGLFRWVKYGFMTAKALLATQGGKAIRDAYDGVAGSRWRSALDLFSTVDGIAADRRAVFGDA